MNATGTFSVSKWDEKDLHVEGQRRLSQVSAVFDIGGDIKGFLTVEYLMHSVGRASADIHDVDAAYVGYLIFTGTIFDRSGRFVLEDRGTYASNGPASFFTVAPDSGSGDFTGISGEGKYYARNDQMIIDLTYSLPG